MQEEENCPVEPPPPPHPVTAPEEDPVQTEAEAESMAPSSFAPEGFVFQAPAGLSAFQPAPLSPSSSSASPSPRCLAAALPSAHFTVNCYLSLRFKWFFTYCRVQSSVKSKNQMQSGEFV